MFVWRNTSIPPRIWDICWEICCCWDQNFITRLSYLSYHCHTKGCKSSQKCNQFDACLSPFPVKTKWEQLGSQKVLNIIYFLNKVFHALFARIDTELGHNEERGVIIWCHKNLMSHVNEGGNISGNNSVWLKEKGKLFSMRKIKELGGMRNKINLCDCWDWSLDRTVNLDWTRLLIADRITVTWCWSHWPNKQALWCSTISIFFFLLSSCF